MLVWFLVRWLCVRFVLIARSVLEMVMQDLKQILGRLETGDFYGLDVLAW